MQLLSDILITMLICAVVLILAHAARGGFVVPLRPGKDVSLAVTVTARGEAAELEQTLSGLAWLRSGAPMAITVVDAGLALEAEKRTELLCRKYDVQYTGAAAGELSWTKTESTSK